MVSRWARLGYSVVSVAAASIGYTIVGTVAAAIQGMLSDVSQALGICLVVLLYSIPGWAIALPAVLIVERVDGWRFWVWLGLGTALGPLVILAWLFVYSGLRLHMDVKTLVSLWLPAAVAGCATLVYLLLVRRAQRRSLA